GELVLVELAEAQAVLEHHLAHARFELSAQHLHERGFAAAVRADEPVAVAIGELDRDVFEERLGAELNGYVSGGQHGTLVSRSVKDSTTRPGGAPNALHGGGKGSCQAGRVLAGADSTLRSPQSPGGSILAARRLRAS